MSKSSGRPGYMAGAFMKQSERIIAYAWHFVNRTRPNRLGPLQRLSASRDAPDWTSATAAIRKQAAIQHCWSAMLALLACCFVENSSELSSARPPPQSNCSLHIWQFLIKEIRDCFWWNGAFNAGTMCINSPAECTTRGFLLGESRDFSNTVGTLCSWLLAFNSTAGVDFVTCCPHRGKIHEAWS